MNFSKFKLLIFAILLAILTACASEDGSVSSAGSSDPTIKIKVTGLAQGENVIVGSTDTITNVYNGDALVLTKDGTFSLGSFSSGYAYNITIIQQPISQVCTVSNSKGTLQSSLTISIVCGDGQFTVSGKVLGLLPNQSVTLQNNNLDDLTIQAPDNFSFYTKAASGASYNVTVKTQPSSQICTPNNNSGIISDNVTDVLIICSATVYSITGSVTGLSGFVTVQNNDGNFQTITDNSTFKFYVAENSKYNVQIKTQPEGKCLVQNGIGVANNNISNVSIKCWKLLDGGNSLSGLNQNSAFNSDNVHLHTKPEYKTTSYENTTDNTTVIVTEDISKIYTGWNEVSEFGGANQIRIKLYDNGTWTSIDGGGYLGMNINKSKDALNPTITDNGSDFFAAWTEVNSSNKLMLMISQYDQSTHSWPFVNNNLPLNVNLNYSANNPQLLYDNNSVIAIWSENNGTADQIRAKSLDTTGNWNSIDKIGDNSTGINKDPTKNASYPDMILFDSKVYATWTETDGTAFQIRVARYDNSSSWSFVDGGSSNGLNINSAYNASSPKFENFNSKLYLTWSEVNQDGHSQIRIKTFDGTNWTSVDGNDSIKGINKDFTQNGTYPVLVNVVDNSSNASLYNVWLENNGNTQVRVAKFDGASTWEFMDGSGADGLNMNTAKVTGKPDAIAFQKKLTIAWSEKNINGNSQIRMAQLP